MTELMLRLPIFAREIVRGNIRPNESEEAVIVNTLFTAGFQVSLDNITNQENEILHQLYLQASGSPNFTPASEQSIAALPVARSTVDCAICQEQSTNDVMTLPCGHEFHADCVSQWLRVNRNCPNCRRIIE